MSFGGGRGARKPLPPGSEFNWQKAPGELPDGAPTPTFPVCTPRPVIYIILPSLCDTSSKFSNLTMPNQPYETPKAEPLQTRERSEVDRYRALRDRFQNGPYYAFTNAASTSARQGTKERAQFDPFNGMPSYSSRYQKRKRTVPKIAGREYSESPALWSISY
jgi:DNA-directed RNA polymerase III subunit RPC7